ncbi:MAG: TetR/AcrR family transcriptional regulator [Acidobacteriota bacterium]
MRRSTDDHTESSIARTDTRALLLQAAARVVAENPQATLIEIARAAGVGRATLHRHFGSRLDLIRATGLEAIVRLENSLRGYSLNSIEPLTALDLLVKILVPWGEKLRFLMVAVELYDDPELKAAESKVDDLIGSVLLNARTAGVLRQDVSPTWIFSVFEALLYTTWTAVSQGNLAANDAARTLRDTFLQGLGSNQSGHSREAAE